MGASTFAVFTQILVESVVIAILGGIAGLGASWALVALLQSLTPHGQLPPSSPGRRWSWAFAFSAIVGVTAGLIPAFKAARLNVIQALRLD